MNHSGAGAKAPINGTHSKRFALAAESADHASAFGVRASSAPLSQGRLRFDGRAGSWRALSALRPCIVTMNLESVLLLLVILLLLSALRLRVGAGLRVRNLQPGRRQRLPTVHGKGIMSSGRFLLATGWSNRQ